MEDFRIFNLIGEVNIEMEMALSKFLEEVIRTPGIPIIIAINSRGGSISSGFSIYNKIRSVPNKVYTLITGACDSIANIIYLSVPFEDRFYFKYTSFFMHSAGGNIDTRFTPSDLEEKAKELTSINQNILEIITENTAIPATILYQIFEKAILEETIYYTEFEKFNIGKFITKLNDIFN